MARYLQACEGVRPDVVFLNTPVQSYHQWSGAYNDRWVIPQMCVFADPVTAGAHARLPLRRYDRVVFPGVSLVPSVNGRAAGPGYTLTELIAANIKRRPV